jgi:hypothetical protein
MAASKNTQPVAGFLTAMAMIVKTPCDEAATSRARAMRRFPANGGWIIAARVSAGLKRPHFRGFCS